MQYFLSGVIGKQMEDFVDFDYAIDDVEIVEIAKNEGIPAYRKFAAEHEEAIRKILDNPEHDFSDTADLVVHAELAHKGFVWIRQIEMQIKKHKKYMKKQSKNKI